MSASAYNSSPYVRGLVRVAPFVGGLVVYLLCRDLPAAIGYPEMAIITVPLGIVAYWLLRAWGRRLMNTN